MQDDNLRISPPLYIAYTVTSCWRCQQEMPVVALIAPHVIAPHFPEAAGTVCILSNIEELPEVILRFIRDRFPLFQFRYSKMAESRYFANTCPKCGVISGDWYLHDEPDGPFSPMTEEATKEITVETIPLAEPITVRASPGIGSGEMMLKHAKRQATDHHEL